jgi:hypothetical protein
MRENMLIGFDLTLRLHLRPLLHNRKQILFSYNFLPELTISFQVVIPRTQFAQV